MVAPAHYTNGHIIAPLFVSDHRLLTNGRGSNDSGQPLFQGPSFASLVGELVQQFQPDNFGGALQGVAILASHIISARQFR